MPDALWDLSACELVDMFESHVEAVNEQFDTEMQRTAWFTSHLMNASGNMKKSIKPERLYVPLEKQKAREDKEVTAEYVNKQREELKKKFNIG